MKSSRLMILAGVLSAAAGCSSTDDFVGSWKYTSGTITTNCQGDSSTDALTGNITINEGSSSDLILVDDQCSLKLTIDGDKATLDGSQTCVSDGGDITMTFTSFTFTTDDGETGRLSSSGTASVNVGGAVVNCTLSGSGDLEKL